MHWAFQILAPSDSFNILQKEGGFPTLQLSPHQFGAKNGLDITRFGNFPRQPTPSD
tara:strand:- start:2042 stop:2209 length:168 start_codon:yes stop_codon:yes gene_type:complete